MDEELTAEEIEETETAFIAALRQENTLEEGFSLVDDGTLDTVLECPQCQGWLRFDGRASATDFMENDRECWLCGTHVPGAADFAEGHAFAAGAAAYRMHTSSPPNHP